MSSYTPGSEQPTIWMLAMRLGPYMVGWVRHVDELWATGKEFHINLSQNRDTKMCHQKKTRGDRENLKPAWLQIEMSKTCERRIQSTWRRAGNTEKMKTMRGNQQHSKGTGEMRRGENGGLRNADCQVFSLACSLLFRLLCLAVCSVFQV